MICKKIRDVELNNYLHALGHSHTQWAYLTHTICSSIAKITHIRPESSISIGFLIEHLNLQPPGILDPLPVVRGRGQEEL